MDKEKFWQMQRQSRMGVRESGEEKTDECMRNCLYRRAT
jgi:hypothetical protein